MTLRLQRLVCTSSNNYGYYYDHRPRVLLPRKGYCFGGVSFSKSVVFIMKYRAVAKYPRLFLIEF